MSEKLTLFKFINEYLFGSNEKWKQLIDADKKKHFFMSVRFISIKYPVLAADISIIKINEINMMDFIHAFLLHRHGGRAPSWLTTKLPKKDNKKEVKLNKEALDYYCKSNMLIDKDVEFMKLYAPDYLSKEVKSIEKLLKEYGK